MKLFSSFHLSLFGASCAGILALVACGGISDPSKSGDGTVATVSGALKGGNVPDGARVALVWRVASTGAYAVGNDAPVSNGAFSMALTPPDASYLFDPSDESYGSDDGFGAGAPQSGGGGGETDVPIVDVADASAGDPKTGGASPGGSGFSFATKLGPRDGASGTIGKSFFVGLAGFVVYIDTNGNGKLDITGQYASTSDTVIGGSSELALTYLRDGSALDYEKLRDSANHAPAAGFNLLWTSKSRWLPLTSVDLDLTSTPGLPSNVCRIWEQDSISGASAPIGPPPTLPTGADAGATTGYPSPTDPDLWCAPDGSYYSYGSCSHDPAPTPEGLCAPAPSTEPCAKSIRYLPGDGTVPQGWPCTVPEATDAGAPLWDAGEP